jgi:hypothetical protein
MDVSYGWLWLQKMRFLFGMLVLEDGFFGEQGTYAS